jgi:hypothetical protein
MSAAYLDADRGGLERLALLREQASRGELPPSAHAAITALEDRYGLSPRARQLAAIASSACLPRLPSAACSNASSVSARQHPTAALNRSSFVPNRRKTYGCEIPARRTRQACKIRL